MSGYTKVDNWLFDEVLPNVSGGTFKLIMIVARFTDGWNKESDMISYSQFEKAMGVSRPTVMTCIQDAIKSGYLEREKCGQGFKYWLPTSKETLPDQLNNLTSTSKETLPVTSKKTLLTKENRKESIKDLSNDFTSIAGVFPNAGFYEMDWEEPLGVIYDRAGGDYEVARDLIEQAIEFARNGTKKRYTITSPKSIINIVANLEVTDKKLSVGAV